MSATLLRVEHRVPTARPTRHIRIALAGCGIVGSELVRLIAARPDLSVSIARVLVRDVGKPRAVPLPQSIFTDDVATFLAADADVVIEAIGGLTPAFHIARTALGRGQRFITANKALLAHSGETLMAVARSSGAEVDFEAAVGGGVPIVRALRHSLRNVPVRRIRGILNGTTNYIFTRIERGYSFEQALREAQANGFAEADPARDLNGLDAADKLRVLAWVAFGVAPNSLQVQCNGVPSDSESVVREARLQGQTVRLIATCARDEYGGLRASVRPELVPADSPFGRANDEQNVISLDLGWNQEITLSGPGAGGLPTATALLGDLLCC